MSSSEEPAGKKAKMSVKLAVISPSTGPIISSLPVAKYPDVEFIVANDLAAFEVRTVAKARSLQLSVAWWLTRTLNPCCTH